MIMYVVYEQRLVPWMPIELLTSESEDLIGVFLALMGEEPMLFEVRMCAYRPYHLYNFHIPVSLWCSCVYVCIHTIAVVCIYADTT
jgi:hypothetical protein